MYIHLQWSFRNIVRYNIVFEFNDLNKDELEYAVSYMKSPDYPSLTIT
jgi:hypothetical protein